MGANIAVGLLAVIEIGLWSFLRPITQTGEFSLEARKVYAWPNAHTPAAKNNKILTIHRRYAISVKTQSQRAMIYEAKSY